MARTKTKSASWGTPRLVTPGKRKPPFKPEYYVFAPGIRLSIGGKWFETGELITRQIKPYRRDFWLKINAIRPVSELYDQ